MEGIDDLDALGAAKGFKLVHLNVRSIVKKMDQIRTLLFDSKIDVVSISETWLKPYLNTKLVALEGYDTYRLDRATNKGKKRGGGLLLYINKKYSSSVEPLPELNVSNENIEAQWVLIHRPHCKNMVVCNVYRPPNGDLGKAVKYLDDCLKTINMSKIDLFLLGDFNVDYKNMSSPNYKKLSFFAQSNSLSQHIKTTTRNTDKTKSIIDLALSNSKFVSKAGTLNHFISDHQPIYVIHKKVRDMRKSVQFIGRSYRDFDKEVFKNRLRDRSWEEFEALTDPEMAWEFILNQITPILDDLCPLRTFHIKNYRPDWMTNELIEQIKDRDYFYKKAKKRGDADSWNIAKYLRNVTNTNIRQAKREFILTELKENENNCKKFWKIIREIIPSDNSADRRDIVLQNGKEEIPKNKVAHFINDYFVNIGNPPTTGKDSETTRAPNQDPNDLLSPLSVLPSQNVSQDTWSFIKFKGVDVHKVVADINVSKSSGLENISSMVIKECFKILNPQITHMYNLSIEYTMFPNAWKKALVIPIPKTGNLKQVKNYRPISLLPLPGKILEKLVHAQLSNYLEDGGLLNNMQHGFRKNHSTIHSIAQLTGYINKKMDSSIPTLAVFIDFRKAFDCVQHSVLLDKLTQLNLNNSATEWIGSYLTSRKQRVLDNNTLSDFLDITQGVPQGSVLGPLFYIIYANDLIKYVNKCQIALYADDTVLYIANKDPLKSITKLRQDVEAINTWCQNNGIKANTDKTRVMAFGGPKAIETIPDFEIKMNGAPLQSVLSYKYLGITLDGQLTYNLQINRIISSVSGKLKQFQRMRSFLSTKAAILVYKSMLLPILEYGDIFLSAASVENRKKLQILQNKGLRCALNKGIEASRDQLHDEAGLLRLNLRREQHLLNYMYDCSQDPQLIKKRSTESVQTRSHLKKLLKVKKPITEKFKKSLAYKGPVKWNSLPINFHTTHNKATFKMMIADQAKTKAIALRTRIVVQ